jgi:hypothetical protein
MMLGLGLAAAWLAVRGVRAGRRATGGGTTQREDLPEVESEDSFPASDPPSHTPTTGATILPPGIH